MRWKQQSRQGLLLAAQQEAAAQQAQGEPAAAAGQIVEGVPAALASEELPVPGAQAAAPAAPQTAEPAGPGAGEDGPGAAAEAGADGAAAGSEAGAAEAADSPVRAKRKDTRSAMAKKLGWGAPRRRRKPKGATAGAKAPAKRPSPRPSAASKPRPPKSAPNQSPAAAAREAEQLSDEALARALQQEELGTRKRTRKPAMFDPVAEAARPQLARAARTRKSEGAAAMDLCCDTCLAWYTIAEVGVTATEAEALDEWHCGICLGTHKPSDEARAATAQAAGPLTSPKPARRKPGPPPGPPPKRVPGSAQGGIVEALPAGATRPVSMATPPASAEPARQAKGRDEEPDAAAAAAAVIAASTAAIQQRWTQKRAGSDEPDSAAQPPPEKRQRLGDSAEPEPVGTSETAAEETPSEGESKGAEQPLDTEAPTEGQGQGGSEAQVAKVAVAGAEDATPPNQGEEAAAKSQPQPQPAKSATAAKWSVGDLVFMAFEEAGAPGGLKDWPGRVDAVEPGTGRMTIIFEDGGVETAVEPVRLIPPPRTFAQAAHARSVWGTQDDPDLKVRRPAAAAAAAEGGSGRARLYGKQGKGVAPDAKRQAAEDSSAGEPEEDEAAQAPTDSALPWSKEESDKLRALIEEEGTGRWQAKAAALGTGRSAGAVAQHYSIRLFRDAPSASSPTQPIGRREESSESEGDDDFDDFAEEEERQREARKKKSTRKKAAKKIAVPVESESSSEEEEEDPELDAELAALVRRHDLLAFGLHSSKSVQRCRCGQGVEEDVPPEKLDAAILRRSTLAAWCEKTNFVRRQRLSAVARAVFAPTPSLDCLSLIAAGCGSEPSGGQLPRAHRRAAEGQGPQLLHRSGHRRLRIPRAVQAQQNRRQRPWRSHHDLQGPAAPAAEARDGDRDRADGDSPAERRLEHEGLCA